ncbi:WD_0033/WD_0034 family tandem repeat-containing protein [Wolbachia endosymbiont (group A) of Endotricha flammealis]|uniref:WD_0033/WD_0034 family tandem repeat-containing protein n=1 Tax=Wolbachia endosymbiont (group A) of Endotricha flammealis TaxID=2954004 RepID=UPI00222E7B10|nr:hypothetical protein [Wolbachia endosymbiont (group A) of Endotricha flammealis]
MPRYEDLKKEQKELYDKLKTAIQKQENINDLYEKISCALENVPEKEDWQQILTAVEPMDDQKYTPTLLSFAISSNKQESIQGILHIAKSNSILEKVLTTANITKKLLNDTEYTLTPLTYAMNLNNFEEIIKVILDASEDKKEVLTTANITEELSNGTKCTLTPLAYAINLNNFEEIIKVILDASEDKKEVLTTANITEELSNGTKCTLTPLAYAMDFNNFEKRIKVILDASEDKKEVLTTANITKKLSNDTEYTLTPLAYAMDLNHFEKIIKVILDASEDKKEVLTTANITKKLSNGTKYTLTPLAYAMNLNNFEKRIKVILDVAEKNSILKEVFVGIHDHKRLQEILETLKNQEQNEEQKTKIDGWLEILVESISKNEKNIANNKGTKDKDNDAVEIESNTFKIENSDQKDIVKTTNKSIMIGSVCGVIAALAVGIGCGIAGVELSILAIAVAAALVIGVIAGGITYSVSKPSDKLDKPDLEVANQQVPERA